MANGRAKLDVFQRKLLAILDYDLWQTSQEILDRGDIAASTYADVYVVSGNLRTLKAQGLAENRVRSERIHEWRRIRDTAN